MKAYELLFIVAPTIDDETRAGVMKRIETTITDAQGVVDNVDNWGKRKLAYEINGLSDGDYTLIDFHADPEELLDCMFSDKKVRSHTLRFVLPRDVGSWEIVSLDPGFVLEHLRAWQQSIA